MTPCNDITEAQGARVDFDYYVNEVEKLVNGLSRFNCIRVTASKSCEPYLTNPWIWCCAIYRMGPLRALGTQ